MDNPASWARSWEYLLNVAEEMIRNVYSVGRLVGVVLGWLIGFLMLADVGCFNVRLDFEFASTGSVCSVLFLCFSLCFCFAYHYLFSFPYDCDARFYL